MVDVVRVVGVIRRAWALFMVVGLVLSAGAPAGATTAKERERKQRREEIKQEIRTLREEVEEASEEESELLGLLDDVQARRSKLDKDIKSLDSRIDMVQHAVDQAAKAFDDLSAQLVTAQLKLNIATDEETAAKNNLRDRAVEAYIHKPELGAAGFIMHAGTLRALAASKGYYKAVINQHKIALDRYTKLKEETARLRQGVEEKRDEARRQQDEIVAQRQKLEDARAEREVVRQQVVSEEQQREGLLAQIQAKKAEFQTQIAALQAESSAIALLLQGVQTGQIAIPPGSGRLTVPIPNARLTSTFGPRMHPIFHEMRMHTGVDFAAAAGTPIRAAADGVVVYAGARGGYGNATIIDHGASLATLTAHQSAVYVTVGQRVKRGQVIGAVGCTGFCTGPHLHFEVRVAGAPVDPLPYF